METATYEMPSLWFKIRQNFLLRIPLKSIPLRLIATLAQIRDIIYWKWHAGIQEYLRAYRMWHESVRKCSDQISGLPLPGDIASKTRLCLLMLPGHCLDAPLKFTYPSLKRPSVAALLQSIRPTHSANTFCGNIFSGNVWRFCTWFIY